MDQATSAIVTFQLADNRQLSELTANIQSAHFLTPDSLCTSGVVPVTDSTRVFDFQAEEKPTRFTLSANPTKGACADYRSLRESLESGNKVSVTCVFPRFGGGVTIEAKVHAVSFPELASDAPVLIFTLFCDPDFQVDGL